MLCQDSLFFGNNAFSFLFSTKGVFIVSLFFTPLSFSQSHWEKRKLDFDSHYMQYNLHKENKLNKKQDHSKQKNQEKIQKDELRNQYINNRTIQDSTSKAQKLFQTFLEKKPPSHLKKDFLKKRDMENKIKEKYEIPLEKEIFF